MDSAGTHPATSTTITVRSSCCGLPLRAVTRSTHDVAICSGVVPVEKFGAKCRGRRAGDPGKALALLRSPERLTELLRPILAAALAAGCPIWTEVSPHSALFHPYLHAETVAATTVSRRETSHAPATATASEIHCSSTNGPPSGFDPSCSRRNSTANLTIP